MKYPYKERFGKSLYQMQKETGINYNILVNRIKKNPEITYEELIQPVDRHKIKYFGKTIGVLSKESGVDVRVLRERIYNHPEITYEELIRPLQRTRHEYNKTHPILYRTWESIKSRCYYPNHHRYHRYGGRGIKVCNEWLNDPAAFCEWAIKNGWEDGKRLTIERINRNGNYEPSNCCWIHHSKQARNKSTNVFFIIAGQKKCIAEWAEIAGIQSGRIYGWIHKYGKSETKKRLLVILNKVNIGNIR